MKIHLQLFLDKESCKTSGQVDQITKSSDEKKNKESEGNKSDSCLNDKQGNEEIVLEDNIGSDKLKNKRKIGLRK